MRAVLLVVMIVLGGCTSNRQRPVEAPGGEVARQLRVAAAAERGGQFDVALQIYDSLASANPAEPDVAARRATLLTRIGEAEAALEALQAARRRHPANAALLQAEGRALLELGRAQEALAVFGTHLRAAPNDAASLNGRAVALDLLGLHQEAHTAYRAARAADPRDPLLVGNFALSLVLAGCPNEAAALLDGAPRSMETLTWIGEIRTLARNLANPGDDVPLALRAALPTSPGGCAAA